MRPGTNYPRSPEGELINRYRLRADMSQETVAERIGIGRSLFSLQEAGRVRVSPELIARLAGVLKLSLAEEQELLAARQLPWSFTASKREFLKNLGMENLPPSPSGDTVE